MANVLKSLNVVKLTDSFQTIYTVPDATSFTVAVLHLTSIANATRTVSVCLVPNEGSPSADNAILWDFAIAAHDILEMLKGDVWPAGTMLQARADNVDSITLKMSGIEST